MKYKRKYYVYIVANRYMNMIYIGVTNDLVRRIGEHYDGRIPGFSKKFNCKYLVYYEVYDDIRHAISREKVLKNFRRDKKNKLISKKNPDWKFLNEWINKVDSRYF